LCISFPLDLSGFTNVGLGSQTRDAENMLSQSDNNVLNNKNFRKLVRARRWISWSFLLVLLGLYLVFGLLSVYYPSFLARPVFSGGITPVGIAMGYLILTLTFVLTVVYVWIANSYFEPLERKVIEEVKR